jgi:hypothetical protein
MLIINMELNNMNKSEHKDYMDNLYLRTEFTKTAKKSSQKYLIGMARIIVSNMTLNSVVAVAKALSERAEEVSK